MANTEQEYLRRLEALPPEERQKLIDATVDKFAAVKFVPNPGPQTDAYFSKADILLFGGSPGGGKTALEIGLALNEHHRSLIVRRQFSDLGGIIDTAKKLAGGIGSFVGGARPEYRKEDGGVIHFAGLAEDGGIGGHQGVDHDLICVDEAATVPEDQVRLLRGWLRSDRKGQRKRMILGSNPPLDNTGDWLVSFFAPWLDDTHPNPALPGELRWFMPDEDGKDRECGQEEFGFIRGVKVFPSSRTFIPSAFTDNPFYDSEEYAKSLASLPEEKRAILVSGNFMLARSEPDNQMIPTAWIKAAQERWKEDGRKQPMTAIGADVADGGGDNNVLAKWHGLWMDKMPVVPGKDAPDGSDVAALIVKHRRDQCDVALDMGGGYGGAPKVHLEDSGIVVHKFKGVLGTEALDETKTRGFVNLISEAYWRLREALDPDQSGGSDIALPNDPELTSDLTAVTFEMIRYNGRLCVKKESKKDIKKKLGRSPDKGDACVIGHFYTRKAIKKKERGNKQPKANVGYANRKRSRR